MEESSNQSDDSDDSSYIAIPKRSRRNVSHEDEFEYDSSLVVACVFEMKKNNQEMLKQKEHYRKKYRTTLHENNVTI